jgi:hypothetical protein
MLETRSQFVVGKGFHSSADHVTKGCNKQPGSTKMKDTTEVLRSLALLLLYSSLIMSTSTFSSNGYHSPVGAAALASDASVPIEVGVIRHRNPSTGC